MNKAGLLAALVGAVGLAYVAYPKTDRTPGFLAKAGLAPTERDPAQPTALEKLKSATKVSTWPQEGQATLPAPRVVDHVKHEIQTRPNANPSDAAAAQTPAAATVPTAAQQSETAGQAGSNKLTDTTPGTSSPVPATATAVRPAQLAPPAQTATSTIIIPRSLPAAVTTPGPASPTSGSDSAATLPPSGADTAKVAATDKGEAPASVVTPRKAADKDRRRPAQRAATSHGAPRPPRVSSVFGRNDGL